MGTIDWKKKLTWTNDQLSALRNAGYSYIRQGKYDIALPFFEALVVLDSESAYDIQTLGALYLQLNNPAKALKCFDKALKVNAEHAVTLLNITKALFALGKKEEGMKLANILKNDANPNISNVAKAFLLAFS